MDAFDEHTLENQTPSPISEEMEITTDLLKEEQEYNRQIRRYSVIESIILTMLAVMVTITFSYLLKASIVSRTDVLFYIVSMLITPSGIFLLLLHFYDLYSIFTTGKKLLPLILDIFYFFCVPLLAVTIFSLDFLYGKYHIPSTFLTMGWISAAVLLFLEVAVAYGFSSVFVKRSIAPRFPQFFPMSPLMMSKKLVIPVISKKPMKQIFYVRKKSDSSVWANEECFVRYER